MELSHVGPQGADDQMLEDDRTVICGPRYAHQTERQRL